MINGNHLTINDDHYGTVDDGDYILVDGTDVYVDNVQRKPSGTLAQ